MEPAAGSVECYAAAVGVDLFIGRRLPRLLCEARLTDVRVRDRGVFERGNERRSILSDFVDNLEGRLVASRLMGRAELSRHRAALRRHLDDPETLVVSHLFFMQAWGRKPGGTG